MSERKKQDSLKINFSTKKKPKNHRHEPGGYYWIESEDDWMKRNFKNPRQRKIQRERRGGKGKAFKEPPIA